MSGVQIELVQIRDWKFFRSAQGYCALYIDQKIPYWENYYITVKLD